MTMIGLHNGKLWKKKISSELNFPYFSVSKNTKLSLLLGLYFSILYLQARINTFQIITYVRVPFMLFDHK